MNADLTAQAMSWIGIGLMAMGAILAIGALIARSLFAMCAYGAAFTAVSAAALLAFGYGDGGLALALAGVGVAPALMLGVLLLSARAAKPRRGVAWLSVIAGAAAGAGMLWVAAEFAGAPRVVMAAPDGAGVWIAVLVFAAIAACAALLGYGERGVLERRDA